MADPRLLVGPRIFGIFEGELWSGFNAVRPNAPAQVLHKGWDVGAPYKTNIRALGAGKVMRVRDFGSVRGYNQEITVWYDSAQTYVLYGHVAAGIPLRFGQRFAAGDILARVGTREDAMDTPNHAHIQCWKRWADVATYDNDASIDPARVRRWYGGF